MMLIITLGDPLSITAECLWQLGELWQRPLPGPVVFVGSWAQWEEQSLLAKQKAAFNRIKEWASLGQAGRFFLDIDTAPTHGSPRLLSDLQRGKIAVSALESLRSLPPFKGKLAVLTAPIDKHICQQAGFPYPGQTEFFSELWQQDGIMILAGPQLRVALASAHIRLADVPKTITAELIQGKLEKLHQSLREIFAIEAPRIAVAALNPHAGDKGMFGDEDQRVVAPAVLAMQQKGLNVSGPKSADTLFFQAYQGSYDAVLAMYHDQGLAPLKTVHFYDAVNITGGLPHLRISPDHGPASEIYGKGLGRPDSFRSAFEHAFRYLGW